MRKGAFTLVELMVVVMVLGILMAIAVPNWVRARETARRDSCLNNLREIEHAKQRYAMEFRLAGTDAVNEADIAPEFLKNQFPQCPNGGTYTLGVVDEQPSCSIHGTYQTTP